jgi:hypothetical protein
MFARPDYLPATSPRTGGSKVAIAGGSKLAIRGGSKVAIADGSMYGDH